MASIEDFEDIIKFLVIDHRYTHDSVSVYLKEKYGVQFGFSTRSIRRFCADNQISRTAHGIQETVIDEAVVIAQRQVS